MVSEESDRKWFVKTRTKATERQIDKDVEALMKGGVDKVEWHLFKSKRTGVWGYSEKFTNKIDKVNEQLKAAGKQEIEVIAHPDKSF